MSPRLLRFTFVLSFCLFITGLFGPLASAESPATIGLMAGAKSGTYIQIGHDIAALAKEKGVDIQVYESNGSLENIAAVFEREEVQLGLVQSDVLGYLQESQNRKLERVAQQIAMMFPLYNEEVHLLAKKSITSIEDLNHKQVAVGSKGSGTNLTSELLFDVTNVWPRKKYLLSGKESLKRLQSGEIDALFYVSGYPVELFKDIDGDKFHLITIKINNVDGYYIESTIPKDTYQWQKKDVQTIAVKAVLMTAGFYSEHCQGINKMVRLVENNIDWLKANGHPKWQEVELDFVLKNWDRYGCEGNN